MTPVLRRAWTAFVGVAVVGGSFFVAPAATADPVPPGATVEQAPPGGTYVAVTPTRVLDTRSGLGGTRGQWVTVPILGHAGVPSTGVLAAVLSVTVVNPSASGFTSVDGVDTSIGNFRVGQTVAQLATSRLVYEGNVQIRTSADADKVADVVGYFTDPATVSAGGTYHPASARLLDTRTPASGGPTSSGVARRIVARGVPAGARSAVVNITVVRPAAAVYATAWASGARPVASVVNAVAGEVRSTRTVVPLAADGSFQVAVVGGRSDLVVDLSGWFGGADGAYFQPTSGRLADTRQPSSVYATYPFAWAVDSAVQAVFPPRSNAPSTVSPGALTRPVAAWLNLTVVSGSRSGWTAVTPTRGSWDDAQPPATTSDVNWDPGITANAVVTPVGTDGWVNFQGRQGNPPNDPPQANVVVDLSGVFVLAPPRSAPGLWEQGGHGGGATLAGTFRAVAGIGGAVAGVTESSDGEIAAVLDDGTVLARRVEGRPPTVLDSGGAQVVGGDHGVFVRRRDGTVWTDDFSPGASGAPGASALYRQVVGIGGAVDIAAWDGHPAAVLADGSVMRWGGAGAPQATPVPVAGRARHVAVSSTGPACIAYDDGSVDVLRPDGSRAHLAGVGAVQIAALPNVSGNADACYATDGDHRLHLVSSGSAGDGLDRLVPGGHTVSAMTAIGFPAASGLTVAYPWLRIVDDARQVFDLGADGTWTHLTGLDGATAVGAGPAGQLVAVAAAG